MLCKQLGVNSDKMIDLAFQSSKIKDVKMGINAEITDEGMRETLAAMAQKKDGKWTVDVGGEDASARHEQKARFHRDKRLWCRVLCYESSS